MKNARKRMIRRNLLVCAMTLMALASTPAPAHGSGNRESADTGVSTGRVAVAVELPDRWSSARYDTIQIVLRGERGTLHRLIVSPNRSNLLTENLSAGRYRIEEIRYYRLMSATPTVYPVSNLDFAVVEGGVVAFPIRIVFFGDHGRDFVPWVAMSDAERAVTAIE